MQHRAMDKASQVLAEDHYSGEHTSFRARSRRSNVPRTTLQHRARGRRSLTEKAQSQQHLTPWEEKALVKFLVHQDALGQPVRIKYVGSIAFSLARRRTTSQTAIKPPSKNWPWCFYRRHPELKASTAKALDWNRHDIREKVVHWFDIIGQVLQDCDVLQENVYNMDETGVMLCQLGSVKVLVSRESQRGCRGAHVKRTTITAIECVSADGRYLHPTTIWPASTHRSNWSTWPTPRWHYGFSDSGFADSYLSLQWLELVFDPQTKDRAGHKPRVLVCDGFGTHETLGVLESWSSASRTTSSCVAYHLTPLTNSNLAISRCLVRSRRRIVIKWSDLNVVASARSGRSISRICTSLRAIWRLRRGTDDQAGLRPACSHSAQLGCSGICPNSPLDLRFRQSIKCSKGRSRTMTCHPLP